MKLSLSKQERLHKRDEIKLLFEKGNSISEFPVSLIFFETKEQAEPLKAAFSVPKKKFKRAVDRNLLKRRMKEAYRINKTPLKLMLENEKGLLLMFVYIGKEAVNYRQIEYKIILLLQRLQAMYE